MQIKCFDPGNGLYHFILDELITVPHHHPVLEILWTRKATLELVINGQRSQAKKYTLIPPNVMHSVRLIGQGPVHVLMIKLMGKQLTAADAVELQNMVERHMPEAGGNSEELHHEIIRAIKALADHTQWDTTHSKCIRFLTNEADNYPYGEIMSELEKLCFLSRSRISHKFRAGAGLPVRQYYLWTKLLSCMHLYLNEGSSLMEAVYSSGFYDQAHFSRTFRRFMGVNLSQHYNSRIVQEFNR